MKYLGIDLGTSALKVLLVDADGTIAAAASREYPLSFPHAGWSEQDPSDWWEAVRECVKELSAEYGNEIGGIGVAGQMHGLVVLDENDEVIRPCILWNDGRTDAEVEYLNREIGVEKLNAWTANMAFAGFTAPKILWMRKNEPEKFARIHKIMLPKDYVNYLLTGVHSTDYSDAAGMLLLDVRNKRWSEEMLKICGIEERQLPALHDSYDVVGKVKAELCRELGLREDVIVVAGAGDNAAAAIGTATVRDGSCNISLGTSGTIFIASDEFRNNRNNAIHNFNHANGRYHLMGCMLSAASCNKWFSEEILKTDDYAAEQGMISEEMLGNNSVYFLPYLMGERSPINDTDARGMFIGMSMNTSREEMYLAVLEGVAFAIRDSLEVARESGLNITESKICGGGSKSALWRRIIADVLNIRLASPVSEQGPGYGGAMLAMVASGEYESVEECADRLIRVREYVEPDPETAERYEARYQKFKKVYPAVRQLFKELK